MDGHSQTERRNATLTGAGAVLLWGTLAALTVRTGAIPPFQLVAMAFAVAFLLALAKWLLCGERIAAHLRQPLSAWLIGVGGLFGFHFFLFVALRTAPPVEANLINYLWPLLIVLFSAALPGERLRPRHVVGAAAGFAGAVLLVARGGRLDFDAAHLAGYGAALVSALIWSSYSVATSRQKTVPTDALGGFCLATAILAALAGALFSGQIPLMDSFAAWSSRKHGFAFGAQRAVGSATFIGANLGAGWLVGRFGGEAALYWMAGGAALTVATAYFLPPGARHSEEARSRGIQWRHLLNKPLLLALGASALIQGSHAFYYGFSATSWEARGISPALIGALWSTGVVVEIVFLATSGRWVSRIHPALLLLAAAGFGVFRWTVTALSPPLAVLFLLQMMHAATFAAAYLGFLRFASEHSPDHLQASTQAANSALSGGIALALMTSLSGWAYDLVGEAGFALMAFPAAAGGVCAWILLRLRTP